MPFISLNIKTQKPDEREERAAIKRRKNVGKSLQFFVWRVEQHKMDEKNLSAINSTLKKARHRSEQLWTKQRKAKRKNTAKKTGGLRHGQTPVKIDIVVWSKFGKCLCVRARGCVRALLVRVWVRHQAKKVSVPSFFGGFMTAEWSGKGNERGVPKRSSLTLSLVLFSLSLSLLPAEARGPQTSKGERERERKREDLMFEASRARTNSGVLNSVSVWEKKCLNVILWQGNVLGYQRGKSIEANFCRKFGGSRSKTSKMHPIKINFLMKAVIFFYFIIKRFKLYLPSLVYSLRLTSGGKFICFNLVLEFK